MSERNRNVASAFIFGLLLAAVTFAAYWPALHGQLLWDDNAWTTDISRLLRDTDGLNEMWARPTALQQYYPLTGTTFWLDYQFWELRTFPYHVENVVLHLIAVFLFWKLLQKLAVPAAWLAAGFFALHPAMVESVAWITERKNVLSMVFYLGAFLAYGRFNGFWKADGESPRRWGAYGLSFILLAAALLAKTATFSFPAVVLLIAWWRTGHIRWRRDVLPTLPFFAIAISFSAITFWLEKNHVGAAGWEWALSLPERCLIAGRAFWFYIGKLLWPANLCFIYPRWKPDVGSIWQWLFPVMALGTLIGLWLGRNRIGRGPAATAFFFVGTIFPVLGFMNAYGMRYSFVWDHWVYLPSLGVFALVGALVAHAAARLKSPLALPGFAAMVLPLLAILTWKQSEMYADKETLWRTTIAKNPAAFLAHNNLGYILLERGEVDDAISYFKKSLEINPNFSEPHNNLGDALIQVGRTNEGMAHFKRAVELVAADPSTYAASYYNYGNAWLQTGHPEEAINHFRTALSAYPRFGKAWNNLGVALMRVGQTNEAFPCFQNAIAADPELADPHKNLAHLLVIRGEIATAVEQYEKALTIRPDYEEAFNNLVRLLVAQGRTDEAIRHYERKLRLDESAELRNDLGNLLVRQSRTEEALSHYARAVALEPENGEFHYNLAAALALRGRRDEAIEHYERAIELMPNSALAHNRLGLARQMKGEFEEAIRHYEKAIELDASYLSPKNNLAWLLATSGNASLRDGNRAIQLAQAVQQFPEGKQPQFLDTLAAAYAEAGKYEEAVDTASRAMSLAELQKDNALADSIRTRLRLYESKQAYHEVQ
jgi:tetratricopeptide (TPR) repeat protein